MHENLELTGGLFPPFPRLNLGRGVHPAYFHAVLGQFWGSISTFLVSGRMVQFAGAPSSATTTIILGARLSCPISPLCPASPCFPVLCPCPWSLGLILVGDSLANGWLLGLLFRVGSRLGDAWGPWVIGGDTLGADPHLPSGYIENKLRTIK